MFVEIDTNDNELDYEIMGKKIVDGVSLTVGERIDINGITVTLPDEVVKKLKTTCKEENRSLSNCVFNILDKHYKEKKRWRNSFILCVSTGNEICPKSVNMQIIISYE